MSAGVMIDFIGDSIALGLIVNCGKKEGMKTILQNECEWMTFGWCVAHHLEPALKDSLGKTTFSGGDKLILHMYFLYKKSPKKLQQLRELVNVLKKCMNLKLVVLVLKKCQVCIIVHCLHCNQMLFNSEFSRHICILVMFLLIKVIILLSSHIEVSLCTYKNMFL